MNKHWLRVKMDKDTYRKLHSALLEDYLDLRKEIKALGHEDIKYAFHEYLTFYFDNVDFEDLEVFEYAEKED